MYQDNFLEKKYTYHNGCMLSCFSRVQLFATLWIIACQAPLSMGFSKQEYWSGLPCSLPGDFPTLCVPMDCDLPGSSVHGILQARILEWVAMPSSRGFSRPRDQTCIFCGSCITGRFFATQPPGEAQVCIL